MIAFPRRGLRRALSTSLLVLATGAAVLATGDAALAQDNKDSVQLKAGTTETGKIKSEDYGGIVIDNRGDKTIAWKDVAQPNGIHYAKETAYESAKDQFDAGRYEDALKAFEELKGEKSLRPVIKQHALYYSALIQQKLGKADEALAGYKELLSAFPKSRYLYDVGENTVAIYQSKKDPAGAGKALEQMSTDALTAGVDPGFNSDINVLKGRLLEDQSKYAEAQAAYGVAEHATGASPSVVQQAILGQARCAVALKDNAKAEGLFRKVVTSDGPPSVMAGGWNGLGDLMLMDARKTAKADPDKITDALYCYLRGVVQYVPMPGESTAEYERALFYSSRCFDFLGQLSTKADVKKAYQDNKELRLNQLRRQFPNSMYLQDAAAPRDVPPPKQEAPAKDAPKDSPKPK